MTVQNSLSAFGSRLPANEPRHYAFWHAATIRPPVSCEISDDAYEGR